MTNFLYNPQNINPNCKDTATFQHLISEAFIDVMAYYGFSDTTPVANRSHLQTKLGQTASWLVGNKLVTVSTESSHPRPLHDGGGAVNGSDSPPPMQPLTTNGNQLVNGDAKESKEAPGILLNKNFC